MIYHRNCHLCHRYKELPAIYISCFVIIAPSLTYQYFLRPPYIIRGGEYILPQANSRVNRRYQFHLFGAPSFPFTFNCRTGRWGSQYFAAVGPYDISVIFATTIARARQTSPLPLWPWTLPLKLFSRGCKEQKKGELGTSRRTRYVA